MTELASLLSGIGMSVGRALGSLTDTLSLNSIQAKIQSEVGIFLALKSKIMVFQRSANPIVVSAANALYTKQLDIESRLVTANARMQEIQNQGLDTLDILGDLQAFGLLALDMENQINDVENLTAQAGGMPGSPGMFPALLVGGLFVGAAYILLKRR